MNCPLFVKTACGIFELTDFHSNGTYVLKLLRILNKSIITSKWDIDELKSYPILVKDSEGELYPISIATENWSKDTLEEVKRFIKNPSGFSEYPRQAENALTRVVLSENKEEGIVNELFDRWYVESWTQGENRNDDHLSIALNNMVIMEGVKNTFDKMINSLEFIDGEYKYKEIFNEPLVNTMVKLLNMTPSEVKVLKLPSYIYGLLEDLRSFLDEGSV